ncbi:Dabb family protein [Brachymonas sp.]|uniref:Dabb family protein n=1 Tax=unclassified Brachymonas TaxID=2621329 RepID=UPI0035AF563F
MIKHIVIWTLHNPADAPEVQRLLEGCRHLLPGIVTLEAGIRTEGLEANADVVLYSVFDTRETLDAYQVHPAHMAVKARIKELAAGRVVLDYAA